MRAPLTAPAEAYLPDTDWVGSGAPEELPEWLVHCLALLILCLLQSLLAVCPRGSSRLASWWQDRPDLPAGSAQAEAASIRGEFGTAIAGMCRRHGIGPGHADWPDLARAIVTFGGSLEGFRPGLPPCGPQWRENPNIVPGMVPGFGVPAAATASLLQRQAVANTAPPAPNAMPAEATHAKLPVSCLPASLRQVFARAGPDPPAGPQVAAARCLGLPTLSCLTHGAGARPAPPF